MGAVGGAALVLVALPVELFGRVPPPSGTLTVDAPQVAVVDGDTLRARDAVLRLQGVQAPRRGQTCQRDDGVGYDCGAAAADARRLGPGPPDGMPAERAGPGRPPTGAVRVWRT